MYLAFSRFNREGIIVLKLKRNAKALYKFHKSSVYDIPAEAKLQLFVTNRPTYKPLLTNPESLNKLVLISRM